MKIKGKGEGEPLQKGRVFRLQCSFATGERKEGLDR